MRQRILPFTEDRDTGPFFQAANEERLVYTACKDCNHGIQPAKAHCPNCGSWNVDWRQSAGDASLYSWTVVRHQVHPAYPVPYTVAVVELNEAPGVRFVTQIPGAPDLEAGMAMELWFERISDKHVLPQWKPKN